MTNTEVRDCLTNLAASSAANISPKIAAFQTNYGNLQNRIAVSPVAHENEAGDDEANPQFVADLERLQAISSELEAVVIPDS